MNFGIGYGIRNKDCGCLYDKAQSKLSGCGNFDIVTVHGLGYKAVIKC